MNSVFRYIVESGVHPKMPDYLQRRTRLNNIFGVVLGLTVGALFGFHSLVYNPTLAWIPFVGFITNFPIFLLNRVHLYGIARFFGAVLPLILVMLYVGFLTGATIAPPAGPMAIGFLFMLLPAFLIDPRESLLLPLILVNLAVFGSFEVYKGYLVLPGSELNRQVFDAPPWSWVSSVLAAGLGMVCIVMLVYTYRNQERHLKITLQETKDKLNQTSRIREELEKSVEDLSSAREAEKQQQWISQGINEVNNILGDAAKRDRVYFHLNQFFVRYTKAYQGVFFTVEHAEEEGEHDHLVTQVGFSEEWKRYSRHKIVPGEGLIGQAYMNKATMKLDQVPANFAKIKSVLGESKPQSVVMVPMIVNEKVEGMIELVSFQQFNARDVEFLERAGEIIAAFVVVNEGAKKMKSLLETSQTQAYELKEKEEEMLQNAEEMQATQEELKRTEKRFVARIEELEEQLKQLKGEQTE